MDTSSENSSFASEEETLSGSFGDDDSSTSSSAEEVTPWQAVDDDIVIEILDSSSEESRPKKKRKRLDGSADVPKKTKPALVRQNATVGDAAEKNMDWPEDIADSSKTQARVRNFVFTWNNYKAIDVTNIKNFAKNMLKENPKFYLVIGFEVGGKKNTPHLQGCCLLGKQACYW